MISPGGHHKWRDIMRGGAPNILLKSSIAIAIGSACLMFDPPDARSQGGGCKTRWQVPTGRSFVIKQNNGWTTSCNLIASNPGPHTITYAGESSCDARGTNNVGQMNSRKVRGTIINN